uniref:Tf2-1-like SH3-like domain-containing protein n=1 Tax=Cannabis sativa TaxID=3483 RepID=A0A803QC89_CANSA
MEHLKWLTKILGYDFEIQYKSGLENRDVDALLRVHGEVSLAAIFVPSVLSIPDLQARNAANPTLSKVLKELANNHDGGGFSLVQGCLKFRGRLVLPAVSPFIPLLLREYYSNNIGGHSGVFKTFHRLVAEFYCAECTRTFRIGDMVYVKLQPYRQHTVAKRPNEKLSPRNCGLFQVLAHIRTIAYWLQLPSEATIHLVFHVSLLRTALGPNQQASPLPPGLTANLEWMLEPETVLGICRKTHKTSPQALIKWQNLLELEATWEDFSVIYLPFTLRIS